MDGKTCERFRILAQGLGSAEAHGLPAGEAEELGLFYLRLADAEGRHWEMFRDLSLEAAPRDLVELRLTAMAGAEAEIVSGLPLEPRMH